MRFLNVVMIIGVVAFFMSPPLHASTITFDFSNCAELTPPLPGCPPPNIDAGTNHLTYTSGGLTVGAYGFTTGGTGVDLYIKSLGRDETGLGTAIDSADHEITPADFVNLNLSNLVAKGFFSGTISIQSLQVGEGYTLCQGSAVGALGASCLLTHGTGAGTINVPITWTASTDVIGLMGFDNPTLGADILVEGLTVGSPTPEPATLTLLGMGMLGLAAVRRKILKR
jgi:PEP-CTERM motif